MPPKKAVVMMTSRKTVSKSLDAEPDNAADSDDVIDWSPSPRPKKAAAERPTKVSVKRSLQMAAFESDDDHDGLSPKKSKQHQDTKSVADAINDLKEQDDNSAVLTGKGKKAVDDRVAGPSRTSKWPQVCEVVQVIAQLDSLKFYDKLLVSTYADLPKLKLGELHPLTYLPGDGQFLLSRAVSVMHDLNANMAAGAITFVRSRHYVNPSRFDPVDVTVRPVDNSHLALKEDMNNITIFVSTVIIGESHITSPKRIGIAYDAINFQTKYDNDRPHDESPQSSPQRGLFNNVQSPVVRTQPAEGRALNCSDTVPVYDARDTTFDMARNVSSYARLLPVFEGEIPSKALVAVLYSANTFRKKGSSDRQLSLNIQSAIVMGTI